MRSPGIYLFLLGGLAVGLSACGSCRTALAESKPAARTDRYGDPLPEGARARLGTIRFRHGGNVYCGWFAPDGKTLTSYGADNVFRTWDVATGRELRRCRRRGLEPEFFGSAALSPDGRLLALGCGGREWDGDRTVLLCAVGTGAELRRFTMPEGGWGVHSVAFSPDSKLLAAGDSRGHINIWEVGGGKRRWRLRWEAMVMVTGLAFAPDGRTLASGNGLDQLSLWDLSTGKEVRCLQGNAPRQVGKNSFEARLAFTPDGKRLATANSDNSVRLWDVATGKEVRRFHRGDEGVTRDDFFKSVTGLAFSPDGKVLAVDSWDGIIHVWAVATGQKLRRIDTQRAPFGWRDSSILAFSPDGRTLASWCAESAIRLWDVATGEERAAADAHRESLCSVAFSPDGGTIATGGGDHRVRLWSAASGRQARLLVPPKGIYEIRAVAFSPNGRMLVSTGDREKMYLWRVGGGRGLPSLMILTMPDGFGTIEALSFSPDGRLLAMTDVRSGVTGSVLLWDPVEGKPLRKLEGEEHCCLAFSLDGVLLATGGGTWISHGGSPWNGFSWTPSTTEEYRGGIDLWDPKSGAKLRHWKIADTMIAGLAFAPNGRWLASVGQQDHLLRLWDVSTGQPLRQWEGVECAAISPAGRLIAAGDRAGRVRLWDMVSGGLVKRFDGHQGPVRSLAFSPDGRALVSGSDDTTALVWDVAGLYDRRRPRLRPLTPRQQDGLWDDLAGTEGAKAYRVQGALAAAANVAPFLGGKITPVSAAPARIKGLIANLDADAFSVRQNAVGELDKLGEAATPALRECLAGKPTLEQRRRIDLLLNTPPGAVETTACLQSLRGIEVLEMAATPEARRVLESLAGGAPGARITRAAKASLRRLALRSASAP